MYQVKWVNKKTGESGQGSTSFSKYVCKLICDAANKKCPERHHYPVLAASTNDLAVVPKKRMKFDYDLRSWTPLQINSDPGTWFQLQILCFCFYWDLPRDESKKSIYLCLNLPFLIGWDDTYVMVSFLIWSVAFSVERRPLRIHKSNIVRGFWIIKAE
jgi:hypothetical protein